MTFLSFYVFFSKLLIYPNFKYRVLIFKFLMFLKIYKNPMFYNIYYFLNIFYLKIDFIKELYLSTFDIHSIICLDIGYLYFGEDYKRAFFLLKLNEEYKKTGISVKKEMPDSLYNLIFIFFLSKEFSFVKKFIEKMIFSILGSIILEFNFDRVFEKNNFYINFFKLLTINNKEVNLYKYFFFSLFILIRFNFCIFINDYNFKNFNHFSFLKKIQKETILESKV